jgi:hypothetical protein
MTNTDLRRARNVPVSACNVETHPTWVVQHCKIEIEALQTEFLDQPVVLQRIQALIVPDALDRPLQRTLLFMSS